MTSTAARTDQRNGKAVREYNASIKSLADAEQLRDILDAQLNLHPMNGYLDDATRNAHQLVAEMEADLQDVMDRWTPEQCGL